MFKFLRFFFLFISFSFRRAWRQGRADLRESARLERRIFWRIKSFYEPEDCLAHGFWAIGRRADAEAGSKGVWETLGPRKLISLPSPKNKKEVRKLVRKKEI